MDESVSKRVGTATGWCCALAATFLALPAQAQALHDPTRPPAEFGRAMQGEGPTVESGPRLQSVLISPKRRVAVISGQTVMVGDKFGTAQIASISENEVVLRGGGTTQTLKLYPGMDKTPANAGRNKSRDR
jgi:MSHA biogenesis protein MshK